jgi:hypothetical protein
MDKTLVFEDQALAKGFTQIPNAILRCSTLSVGSRLLYAILLSYAWQDGECFPGQRRLATDMGFRSIRGVQKLLDELREAGLIYVIRRGKKRTNLYVIASWSRLEAVMGTRVPVTASDGNGSSAHSEGDANHSSHHSEVMRTTVHITQGDANCSSCGDANHSSYNEYSDDKQTAHDRQRHSLVAVGLSSDQESVLQSLIDIGVGRLVAHRLVCEYDLTAVRGWLAESQRRRGLTNPAGWVRKQVESGEVPPRRKSTWDDPDRYVSGPYAEFVER